MHKSAYSETFIRDHVRLLPYNVRYAYGGYLANKVDEQSLLPNRLQALYPLSHMLLRKRLTSYIKQHNIKLVVAEYAPVGVHWLPVCKATNTPLLVYCHGYDVTKGSVLKKYAAQYKKLFAYASGIFSVSHAMTEQLIQLGAPQEKIIYNPCGVDIALFASKHNNPNPTILSVGRFVTNKNPISIIDAFARVLQQVPNAQLNMVGDGVLLASCQQVAKDLLKNKVDQITFHGAVPHEKVKELMQQASVYVQASITATDGETEGAPVSIMEAGAAALPVVATNHAGIPDIVETGVTGALVAENDIAAMAKALVEYLQNPALAAQHGQAATQRIEKYFTLERNIRILTETINKSL